ncbi:hypothetical protein DY000_02029065 [Brassica cretica]|uniref:Uncharacterized protein n=1 Tax=Brassica cretica TaxID=69181 RepID=A0ABQ7DV42_BRACR|nr:hypothetical protein DY000_02029065 [Brassica cretica]
MTSAEGPVYGGGMYSNGGSLPRNSSVSSHCRLRRRRDASSQEGNGDVLEHLRQWLPRHHQSSQSPPPPSLNHLSAPSSTKSPKPSQPLSPPVVPGPSSQTYQHSPNRILFGDSPLSPSPSSSGSSRLGSSLFSIFVVFLTDVGSVLVSAVMVGVAEDLFLDEQETAATGFLSFLGNSAASKRLRSTAWGLIVLEELDPVFKI